MIIIVPDNNDSVFEVTLDAITYFFRMSWNSFGEYWTFDIQNANKETLIAGIKVVSNYDLISKYHYLEVPQGKLAAIMPDGKALPNRTDFKEEKAYLVYIADS